MKKIILLLLLSSSLQAQQLTELTVEKIMRDPKWMGVSPSNISWAEDSKQIFFEWNPDKNIADSLYTISLVNKTPVKLAPDVRRNLPSGNGIYNRARTKKVYEKNGDLYIHSIPEGSVFQITNTLERESSPSYSQDERKIFFTTGNNLYSWNTITGQFQQHSDFKRGSKKKEPKGTEQETWLKEDQLAYLQILKERSENRKATEKSRKADQPKRPKEIYHDEKTVNNIRISPDEKYITFSTIKSSSPKATIVPNYVTESGFTEDINARSKVGTTQSIFEFFVYDIVKDTVLQVKTNDIPGILDKTDFSADYPEKKSTEDKKEKKPEPRKVIFQGPYWSDDGKNNVFMIRSQDNKDRWIATLDLTTQKITVIDRQRDEAWIGGPGIGGGFGPGNCGWMSDNKKIWIQSEETGYSHLYTIDVTNGKKQALTSGKYEVQSVELSRDKQNFYLITNEVHPGEKHFYKLPATGGKAVKITTLMGANEVTLSPDEKWLAIRYSYSNKPWELYLMENKPGTKPQQITSSTSSEFNSYAWRDPEIITFKARDGAEVYARLYQPESPKANGPAVVFVHGAGYLQNVHKWWSGYFREFMFHNLLADKGYTVLDIDYRASAGYGRDWRTGIYRFMGGFDLTDQVDGAAMLVDKYNVNAKKIGIYGGSYGGFITLMALFTTPDVFAAGASLRPVTDWAHYNHGYTSNILNEPFADSLAYAKSSPLYHVEGLKGALLICHGMVDTNVHFQDAVRLAQRLIELGKDNWELAVYPVENHGFVEPSSWTDEYKRILKLFETNLK